MGKKKNELDEDAVNAVVTLLLRRRHPVDWPRWEEGILRATSLHLLLSSNHPDPEKWRDSNTIGVLASIDEIKAALNKIRTSLPSVAR